MGILSSSHEFQRILGILGVLPRGVSWAAGGARARGSGAPGAAWRSQSQVRCPAPGMLGMPMPGIIENSYNYYEFIRILGKILVRV